MMARMVRGVHQARCRYLIAMLALKRNTRNRRVGQRKAERRRSEEGTGRRRLLRTMEKEAPSKMPRLQD